MKVRITKCSSNLNWYCGKIGDKFEVKDYNGKWFVCTDGIRLIQKDDCVELLYDADNSAMPSSKPIDAHYSGFTYTLTESDKQAGVLKVDPYFVNKLWGISAKDSTGVLFHCLKNISRYSDKNSKEREIRALYLQVKRLAELEEVGL